MRTRSVRLTGRSEPHSPARGGWVNDQNPRLSHPAPRDGAAPWRLPRRQSRTALLPFDGRGPNYRGRCPGIPRVFHLCRAFPSSLTLGRSTPPNVHTRSAGQPPKVTSSGGTLLLLWCVTRGRWQSGTRGPVYWTWNDPLVQERPITITLEVLDAAGVHVVATAQRTISWEGDCAAADVGAGNGEGGLSRPFARGTWRWRDSYPFADPSLSMILSKSPSLASTSTSIGP